MTQVLHPDVNRSFGYAAAGLTNLINDTRQSGNYYVTHELDKEMKHIHNGVNHMKLDSEFLNSSNEWGRNFDVEAMNREKADAASKLSRGNSFMAQYKSNFNVPQVQTLQENQVRERHQWAGENLRDVRDDLHPYAASAQGRINQFCDYIGVTDRYTGYRNNLTRGSRDPTKLGMAWLNPADKNPYERAIHSGTKPAGQVYLPASLPKRTMKDPSALGGVSNPLSAPGNIVKLPPGVQSRSIQERCGINTTFPGITEYMKRYNQKRLPEKVTAFNINPTPDFSIYGRPSASVEAIPKFTEYQTRYEWPECRKIVKKPWLRK